MNPIAEAKLYELRGKTDRQLAALIANRLDRGLAFARAMQEDEGRDWEFVNYAEGALAEAAKWMPLLEDVPALERRRLEIKAAQLREALSRVRPVHMHA